MSVRAPQWFSIGLVLALAALPRTHRLCSGFLPPNDMRIPVGDAKARGLTEDAYNAVLDRVQEVYAPIVSAKGGRLVIKRLWSDATVNAMATQTGGDWEIHMYGGLARHPAVTEDGFALVACHELGHHVGGFPKISGAGWATNEGGADYYGNLKCLRRVLSADPPPVVDPVARQSCGRAFRDEADRSRCERATMAGVSLASLLNELGGGAKPPSLATPDRTVVARTNDDHPRAQCRLDTYFQASLCTKALAEDVSDKSPLPGACNASEGYEAGIRPLCWFKPPAAPPKLVSRPRLPDFGGLSARLDSLGGELLGRGL